MALSGITTVLLDLDGVLYVEEEPIPGALEAVEELRARGLRLRFVTNTTSRSRAQVASRLARLGFPLPADNVLTPAALAVRRCGVVGHKRVRLLVAPALREDLAGLAEAPAGEQPDAIILGDLGEGFTYERLNQAFRAMEAGAELIALQRNRFWRRTDGLAMDVGAYVAALEYATGRPATVVGKPEPAFFAAALADAHGDAGHAVMVGDDIEADVGGALAAGLAGVLVRTGKYRPGAEDRSGVIPTAVIDSIADLPALLAG
ncbi:TIGR01458 family HAD-type hydrolase [Svornostia abyssi]|uniref:Haloacid dehalogenase-like hydrolase domain-containing protein 2 n=1 Tax=Svornostia abyssi TaxID=2898438 RepID=A0ABY5PEE9_9ACTN|nr:TIGR01458 family HAD-type hydrolase [Parviterribacteraceae bacterium J379]